jgi:hypothetical protein
VAGDKVVRESVIHKIEGEYTSNSLGRTVEICARKVTRKCGFKTLMPKMHF